MKKKYSEGHFRSIYKTISIRIWFTLSHMLNGFIISGSWTVGAAIAGWKAVTGTILYWMHERIWNVPQWGRFEKMKKKFTEGHRRTIGKSITWRIIITISNFLIPYLTTGSWKMALAFTGVATILNIIVYYVHERVWNIFDIDKKIKIVSA